jgi:hypothetical protein
LGNTPHWGNMLNTGRLGNTPHWGNMLNTGHLGNTPHWGDTLNTGRLGNTPHWGNMLNTGHLGDVSEAQKRPDQEIFCIDLHWIAQVQDGLYKVRDIKQTPWSESASELYRPSDRRLSAK